MTNNNYNYAGNYPPINNRAPTPQQSFATSSATAGDPYYGATSATPTRAYPNNDYQYQQYPQQPSTNSGGGYNWGVYSGGKAAPAAGMESLSNPNVPEQTANTSAKLSSHNNYDTRNLGNLAYASGLNYNSVAETAQSTTRYSGASVYEGSARGSVSHQNTPSQVHNHARPDSTGARASPAAGIHTQRQAPEPAAGIKSGTAYNLPTPSPAYPQSLINSYPQRSANTTIPSGGNPIASRATDAIDASSRNMQQSQYAPFTPSQPQKPATARAYKQEQNRQASTPPAASVARNTASASSKAYSNQPRSQTARGLNSQSGRAAQTSPQPAATLPPAKMPTNVIRRTGNEQIPNTENINSQQTQYQPSTSSQPLPTTNYLPLPTQTPTARQQPPQQLQRRSSPDRPTTVDPSHVYNSYHEYQKQIEAAEAEAARLARLKEMAAMEEQRQKEALRSQQQRERADMTGDAVQAAMTLAHTMSANNAAGSESESEASEEDEQGQASGDVDEDNEDGPASENTSHPISAAQADPKGKAPSQPVQMAGPQEPPSDNTAVTMEEEMRRMVEKLRDYQSKDPKLFLQVWSSVRKTGPGQSPQPQAEGSQTKGSPVVQSVEAPQQSPTLNTPRPTAVPKAPAPVAAPVSTPAPFSASKGRKKATPQKPDSSKSPSTQAKDGGGGDINAKRRAKRPSRSKAAIAARAAAEAAATKVPTSHEPALVTPGKPGAVESQENNKSTMNTPRTASVIRPPQKASSTTTTPTVVDNAASNTSPINNVRQTPVMPPKVAGPAHTAHPPPPPQNGSTWPSDKRETIAVTAASVLNEIPENAGKKIESRQIREMLEGNPSYIELCEMIEKLGFRMDRARFAKTLLAVLPGNPRPKYQPPRPAAVTPTSGQAPSVPPAPQAQGPHQNTPQPLPAGASAAIVPPSTPGTAQAALQSGETPGSGTPNEGKATRPVGRPRKDGRPPGAPRGPRGLNKLPHELRYNGSVTQSSNPPPGGERQANGVRPVPAILPPNAAAGAATTAAAQVTTASPNAAAQPPQPTSVTATLGPHPQPPPPPASTTTAPASVPGSQPQSNPPHAAATTVAPTAPGSSAPLSTEEMHHMALLQAYVGKHGQASRPAVSQGGAAGTYSSPYQDKAASPPTAWKSWRSKTEAPPRDSTSTPTTAASFRGFVHSPLTPAKPPDEKSPPVPQQPYYARPPAGPNYGQYPPEPQYYYTPPPASYQPPVSFQGPVSYHPYHSHGTGQPAAPKAPDIPAAPLTKEAQARKRTFAEIIDLTKKESSDKGEEQSEKRQRVGGSVAGERTNSLSAEHGPSTLHRRPVTGVEVETRPPQFPFRHHHHIPSTTQSHNNHTNVTVNLQSEAIARNPLLEYDGIVKPIDRSFALRKSRYDPKTIARDILISAGKHPTQRSLNAHLEQLKERFAKVDHTSDLSTFRWDIVDPGGAAVGSANMHPHGWKPVNYPLGLMQGVYKKYGPNRPSGLRNETPQTNFAIVIPDNDEGDEMDQDLTELPATAPKRRGRPPRDPNAAKAAPAKRVLTRRGRGPSSVTHYPAAPDFEEEEEVDVLPAPKKRTRGPNKSKLTPLPQPRQPSFVPFKCEWRGCEAELMNLETLRRHIYAVHGKVFAKGEFVPKACLWGKCGKKAGSKSRNGDEDVEMGGVEGGVVQRELYGDAEAFKAHLEKAHVVPLSWHMGDGPRGSTLDGNESDHSSYLNSPLTGRPVTPSIATQTVITGPTGRRRGRPAGANAEANAEAEAEAKPWSPWDYWCGTTKYVLKPAEREGEYGSVYAQGGWYEAGDGEGGEGEYGGYADEMRSAARAKRAVYSREMPKEMREALGVE